MKFNYTGLRDLGEQRSGEEKFKCVINKEIISANSKMKLEGVEGRNTNRCSDRSMEVKLPALLGIQGSQLTDRPAGRPTKQPSFLPRMSKLNINQQNLSIFL